MIGYFGSVLRRFHRDEGGQAIFLVLFYFALLAALVFLVLNSGQKANNKIQMQNTADAVVASGASWSARAMNTIAMCNVTQTQLFSVIVLLDTMEEVGPPAQRIIEDLLANIGSSAHGSDVPNDPYLKDWLIINNAQEELKMVRQMNALIRDVPMNEYCLYDSGTLWQCAYVLNEMKTQLATIAPEMVQKQAMDVGDKNGADTAFVLPFYPELPIEPIDNSGGSFRLFRNPMELGRRVYDRRRPIAGYHWLQNYVWHASWGHGNLRATRGPFGFMREPITEPTPMGALELSRYSVLFRQVSDKKLNMLFGGPNEKACLLPANRIEDYDKLLEYVRDNGRDAVIRTYWSYQGFNSRYEYDTASFRANLNLRDPKYPQEHLRVYSGFRPAPGGFTRATTQGQGADARHDLWFRSLERLTPHYPALDIWAPHPPYHPDGSRWGYTEAEMKPYYRNSLWRFDGADVGEEIDLNRRYLPPAGRPPQMAPIELSRTTGRKTRDNIREYFTFVGFAYISGTSAAWPKVFVNPVPTDDKLICYAQAELYNDTGNSGYYGNDNGWDLFTQNWRFRLVRTDQWEWAKLQMDAGIPGQAQGDVQNLTLEQMTPVRKMLEMYDYQTFVRIITH